jgi:hypothetical protein
MDMYSRNQYLKTLREEYLKATKKAKTKLLNEAEKRTNLCRKHLVVKLKPQTNLKPNPRKKRKEFYDSEVKVALVKLWKIFDEPCGQRLKTLLETEVDRLKKLGELSCSRETAEKLKKISFRTIDEKMKHQKEVEFLKRKYHKKTHPLLYQKIPVKLSDEWDRSKLGNIQIDLVEHCGQSAGGEFINTLSCADISTGWWEGEAIMGRGQIPTGEGLDRARKRFPFLWREIHSDNGTEFINAHLFRYTQEIRIGFSRSRPNKKNDNCFVEQKNWTHVKKFVGYFRYDTLKEQIILNGLYRNELRLYKNFFQPVMKLISKERIGGKIKRKYDKAKTPYQRVMESKGVSKKTRLRLKTIYNSLNPAELKRTIERKLDLLYKTYQEKNHSQNINISKKIKPISVRFLTAQPEPISVR